jgi:PAS domain S-box-containing protein
MEAIITIDESQRIVMFNPMAERLFDCAAADALGTALSRFVPDRFRGDHEAHVRQFGVTGVSDRQMGGRRILYGLRATGGEFPFEASISQFGDENGKLYTVMLRDISAQIDAERSLQRSHEELRELSANLLSIREEEKSRIARELHDDLGQQLTALKMDISSLELSAGTGAEARAQLRGMQRLIDATVASMRRIAADLRPVMLDDLGLVPAIDWLAIDFTNRYGIDVERRIDARHTIFNRDGATALFRIVQEALTNVARHAQATRVDLALYLEGDRCILRIADDGVGAHERADTGRKSFGLIGIRERAHGLDGSVLNRVWRGTRVRCNRDIPAGDLATGRAFLRQSGKHRGRTAAMTRVLIADDHALVRDGLRHILLSANGLEVAGEACDGATTMAMIRATPADVLVLDLSMPGRNGVELLKQIKDEKPALRILVLTMHAEQQYAVRAFKAGASGLSDQGKRER